MPSLATLSDRDKRYLAVGGLLLALILGYFVAYEPLSVESRRLHAGLMRQSSDLQWMRQALVTLASCPAHRQTPETGKALLVVVDRTIRDAGLKQQLKRVQPDGDDRLRLWFEHASFASLAQWLDSLEKKQGIVVDSANVDRQQEAGVVSAKVGLAWAKR